LSAEEIAAWLMWIGGLDASSNDGGPTNTARILQTADIPRL
jgi:hypothetical protein